MDLLYLQVVSITKSSISLDPVYNQITNITQQLWMMWPKAANSCSRVLVFAKRSKTHSYHQQPVRSRWVIQPIKWFRLVLRKIVFKNSFDCPYQPKYPNVMSKIIGKNSVQRGMLLQVHKHELLKTAGQDWLTISPLCYPIVSRSYLLSVCRNSHEYLGRRCGRH